MAIDFARAVRRSIAIARFDIPTFEEVEADTSSTQEAGFVAVAASVIGSVGSLFVNGIWGFVASLLIMTIGWFVWAWLSAFIAKKMFNVQTTDVGEMLRTTGYAYAPRVIGIIPFLGIVSFFWTLAAVIVGMRQAGEMTTGQAVITAVVGFIPAVLALGIVTAILL